MTSGPPLKRVASRACICSLALCAAFAQVPNPVTRCQVTSTPSAVSAEGLTEAMGDLILQCSSDPGSSFSGNFTLYFPVPITNRVDAANMTRDAVLSVDLGGGFVPTGMAGLISGSTIAFNNVNYTVPANGKVGLRISNVRGAMNRLAVS